MAPKQLPLQDVRAKKKVSKALINNYLKRTHFSAEQIKALVILYRDLTNDKLDQAKFQEFVYEYFHITDPFSLERVFSAFTRSGERYLTLRTWMEGLSVFLVGTKEERIKYCFTVFDINGDRFIGRDEMFHLLRKSFSKTQSEENADEALKDLVEITLRKVDYDKDGQLGLDDFGQAVKSDNLFLEIFCKCLPTQRDTEAFFEYLKDLL